eukprot:NODE_6096_length_926_cov_38.305106_g5505_i0.p1 GENE.NODE_6096_length_926_cov_38.305106_g5505_i0~~NODE_6096_length_926_cov_38.305106_g5505_i0.p1  ORF type:complete len:223 (-),score=38.95 NODE_6096_length_926_cov_38.305106_g5505_i0:187-855(-)
MTEHEYLKQHNVVQLFDDLTAALLTDKPDEPTQFIIEWLKKRSPSTMKINTSNQNKFKEFQRMFAKYGISLDSTAIDLKEIDSTPEKVVAHKATQVGDNIIIEDTQLDVEGADVGIHVRWLMDNLTEFEGRSATWRVLLGVKRGNVVEIYEGVIKGRIVRPRGSSNFGFDSIFEPLGRTKTLAEDKPDEVNARAMAIQNLAKGKIFAKHPPIFEWHGKWQHD